MPDPNKTNEIEEEKEKKNRLQMSFQPIVYSFDAKNKNYVRARNERKKLNHVPVLKDWAQERRKAEERYRKRVAELDLKQDAELPGLLREIEANSNSFKAELQEAKGRKLRELPQEALRAFPMPKMNLKFLNENQPAPANTDQKRTFCFTKLDTDKLAAISQNKRSFLFFPLKQSPEFKALQDTIDGFNRDYNGKESFGESRDEVIRNAEEMITALYNIKTQADAYIEKYKDTKYSKACNARKEMARAAAEMAEGKIADLMKEVEKFAVNEFEQEQLREEYTQKQTADFDRYQKDRLQHHDNRQIDRIEKYYEGIRAELKKAQQEEEKELKSIDADERRYRENWGKTNTVSRQESFGLNQYSTLHSLPAELQLKLAMIQSARLLFSEQNNPFADFNPDPFTELNEKGEPVKKTYRNPEDAVKTTDDSGEAIPMEELMKKLKESEPEMKAAYSATAMITLANLKIFDQMMGTPRRPLDYKVTVSFVKDGVSIPVANVNNAILNRMSKDGYSCVIDKVKAEPVYSINGKTVELDRKQKNHGIVSGDFVPVETAAKLLSLNEATVNLTIPEMTARNAPASFLNERLKDCRTLLENRKNFEKVLEDEHGSLNFNVLSEQQLKNQIRNAEINRGNGLNPTYFSQEVAKNTPEIVGGSLQKTAPATAVKPGSEAAFPSGSLKTDEKEENAVTINACASKHEDFRSEFNGDAEYLLSFRQKNPEAGLEDLSKVALFENEPSMDDLKGDPSINRSLSCGLSAIIKQDPAKIYDMIKDNNDGTVTCRFYNVDKEPVYVSVSKKLAAGEAEKGPLWLKLLEKGFVLSGVQSDFMSSWGKDKTEEQKAIVESLKQLREQMLDEVTVDDSDIREYDKALNQTEQDADPEESDDDEYEIDEDSAGEEPEEYESPAEKEQQLMDEREKKILRIANEKKDKLREDFRNNEELMRSRSMLNKSDMTAKEAFSCLTGNPVRTKIINPSNGVEFLKAISIEVKSNNVNGNKFKLNTISSIDHNDRSDYILPMAPLINEVRDRLFREKLVYQGSGPRGSKYPKVDAFYLEDFLECVDRVAEEKPGKVKEQNSDDVAEAARILKQNVIQFQKNSLKTGCHLVSRQTGNYSAYAENVFELVGRHKSKGDVVLCTASDAGGKRYSVLECKKGKNGLKSIVLAEENSLEGNIVEKDLNEFIRTTNKLDFEVAADLYSDRELSEKVALSVVEAIRKKFPDEFRLHIDPVLSRQEKIDLLMDIPEVQKLTQTVLSEMELKEKLADGEVITISEKKLSFSNQRLIKDALLKETDLDANQRKVFNRRMNDDKLFKGFKEQYKSDPKKLKSAEALDALNAKVYDAVVRQQQEETIVNRLRDLTAQIAAGKLPSGMKTQAEEWINSNKEYAAEAEKQIRLRRENGDFRKKLAELDHKPTLKELGNLIDSIGGQYDMSKFSVSAFYKPPKKQNANPQKMSDEQLLRTAEKLKSEIAEKKILPEIKEQAKEWLVRHEKEIAEAQERDRKRQKLEKPLKKAEALERQKNLKELQNKLDILAKGKDEGNPEALNTTKSEKKESTKQETKKESSLGGPKK